MGYHSQLDCDVHDLLDEANVRVLVGIVDVAGTKDLIIRMRNCADKADIAKLAESAKRLRDAADVLEHRMQSRPQL